MSTNDPDDVSSPAARAARRTRPSVAMVDALQGARPWAMTVAIVWFVSGGLSLVSGASVISNAFSTRFAQGLGMGASQALGGAICVVLGGLVWSYASGLYRLRDGRTNAGVEGALRLEARFWTFIAAFSLVLLGLAVAGMIAAAFLYLLRANA